jgi:hypothetical protein
LVRAILSCGSQIHRETLVRSGLWHTSSPKQSSPQVSKLVKGIVFYG